MNTKMMHIISHCPEDTRRIGGEIGESLTDGLVISLTGELGSGKTTLVQGLARGLEVPENYYITSPTYTLINEYPGRYSLFHVDLYRLEGPAAFEDIGMYDVLNGEGVVAVEWADKLPLVTLSDHIHISLKIISEESRHIDITAYGEKAVAILKGFEKIES